MLILLFIVLIVLMITTIIYPIYKMIRYYADDDDEVNKVVVRAILFVGCIVTAIYLNSSNLTNICRGNDVSSYGVWLSVLSVFQAIASWQSFSDAWSEKVKKDKEKKENTAADKVNEPNIDK